MKFKSRVIGLILIHPYLLGYSKSLYTCFWNSCRSWKEFSKIFSIECGHLQIKHWKSSVVHPQGNGHAEAEKIIGFKKLKKTLILSFYVLKKNAKEAGSPLSP